jgi:branched-chain amino acid transport system permease protein
VPLLVSGRSAPSLLQRRFIDFRSCLLVTKAKEDGTNTVIVLEVIIGGLLTGGIYALLAAGFSLQYGVARVLNVSHGEFIMLGALSAYSLYVTLGINPLVSLVIVGPILFPIGFLINRFLFQRIRTLAGSREVFEGWSMLVSFGLLFIIQNIALLSWSADQKGYSFMAFPIKVIGMRIPANRLVALSLAVAIGVAFYCARA